MYKYILPFLFLIACSTNVAALSIKVKSVKELENANTNAKPGDVIILQNGEWFNINIVLDCNGTINSPIIFKAETAGKVFITGNSTLRIGGNFIVVDGLYFKNGYAGIDAVVTFKTLKNVANNCKLINTVINDFNNPKRLEENYWIELYGKHNTISRCSFLNKKNIGVLLAVILDDKKSQENFHSINNNYFGVRIPLASNGGEIIRVGVSQQCEFNSNTQIIDNYFDNCDGETEIISLKSGANLVRNNLFKECQGSVVLRHGNNNTVENNIFLGNDKEGTGGVRIINKGQWVINNFFYKCRGEGFRSPLAIMNGIPNSPAFRYLAVSDAVIYGNSFYECAPLSFCEGSDTERSLQPQHTFFANNIIFNKKDNIAYKVSDDIKGIHFAGNYINNEIEQHTVLGFTKAAIFQKKSGDIFIPNSIKTDNNFLSDSLQIKAKQRLLTLLTQNSGFKDEVILQKIQRNAAYNCGAKWMEIIQRKPQKKIIVNCKTVAELVDILNTQSPDVLEINLTEKEYYFSHPINIIRDVVISANFKNIKFIFKNTSDNFLFYITASNGLTFKNINLDLSEINSKAFISTDTSATSNHCNFKMENCKIKENNTGFFYASKTSVCDSIIIENTSFNNSTGTLFNLAQETDKKGYYPVEKIKITNCIFENINADILQLVRTGNDESTMGPKFIFTENKILSCNNNLSANAIISLTGVQKSFIKNNIFDKCNDGKILIEYKDVVRAVHILSKNKMSNSGKIDSNKYVVEEN